MFEWMHEERLQKAPPPFSDASLHLLHVVHNICVDVRPCRCRIPNRCAVTKFQPCLAHASTFQARHLKRDSRSICCCTKVYLFRVSMIPHYLLDCHE
eukprot:12399042-Karenia_brevis.AAC.1